MGGLSVGGFVADDEASVQIKLMLEGGLAKKSNVRLTAVTAIHFVVGTHEKIIKLELLHELQMHQVEFATAKITTGNPRLVRYGNKQQACLAQQIKWRKHGTIDLEVAQCPRH